MYSARGTPRAPLLTTRPHRVPDQVAQRQGAQRQGTQAAPPVQDQQAAMVGIYTPLLPGKHTVAEVGNVFALLGHSMQEQTCSAMLY